MALFVSEDAPESQKVIDWIVLQLERITYDLKDEALKLGDEEKVASFSRALPGMLEAAAIRVRRKLNAQIQEEEIGR